MRQIAACLPERSQKPFLSQPNDIYDHRHYSCGENRVSARYFSKNAPRIIIYPKCTGDNNAKIKQEIQIGMGLLSRPPQSYKIQRSLQEV